MFIRDLNQCDEITAGDNSLLREILNPIKDKLDIGYSLAHAKVLPGEFSLEHKLSSSEVYYILHGKAVMHIDDEKAHINTGQVVYIPPGAVQKIENIGETALIFLCIVEPAWKPEVEEILE
jgi:mannose-6-phosphate isomerase-like protein (cupin superfamily)